MARGEEIKWRVARWRMAEMVRSRNGMEPKWRGGGAPRST